MRYAIVAFEFNVVIDIDPGFLPLGKFIRLCQQRAKRQFIERFKGTEPIAGELFERIGVDLIQ